MTTREEIQIQFKEGDKVHYHPVIGREHDGLTYTVEILGQLGGGHPVAWLSHPDGIGVHGAVSVRALSRAEE